MNNIVRVDKNYQNLSDALLKLGCAIFEMYPDEVEQIKVVLPKRMHRELFGVPRVLEEVVVMGPYGKFRVEAGE